MPNPIGPIKVTILNPIIVQHARLDQNGRPTGRSETVYVPIEVDERNLLPSLPSQSEPPSNATIPPLRANPNAMSSISLQV